MSYKDKLVAFNATRRYELELARIEKELTYKDRILDYGCGTGYAVEKLRSKGFDVHGYDEQKHSDTFDYSIATGKWDVVYFMHSFAHIHGIADVLKVLDTQRIIIITPNKEWLDANKTEDYIPDPTVKRHYTKYDVIRLLSNNGYVVTVDQITNSERLFVKCTKR